MSDNLFTMSEYTLSKKHLYNVTQSMMQTLNVVLNMWSMIMNQLMINSSENI